jgi:hypothetical protein
MSPHVEQSNTSDRIAEKQPTSSSLSQSINFADHNFAPSIDSTAKLDGNTLSFGNPNYGIFAKPTDSGSCPNAGEKSNTMEPTSLAAQPGADTTNPSSTGAAPTDSGTSASPGHTISLVEPTGFGAANYLGTIDQPGTEATNPACAAPTDSAPANTASANPEPNPEPMIDMKEPTSFGAQPGSDTTNPACPAPTDSATNTAKANLDQIINMMDPTSSAARTQNPSAFAA